jgi:hypothetical protein
MSDMLKGKGRLIRIQHSLTIICGKENTMKIIVLSALFCMISISVARADFTAGRAGVISIAGLTVTKAVTENESETNLETAKMQDSKVGGTVVNTVAVQTVTKSATGSQSEANLGTVTMQNLQVGGSVTNTTAGQTLSNAASGAKSEANVGAVKMNATPLNK